MADFCPKQFKLDQFDIVIGNVEYSMDPENESQLDEDDCESILRHLQVLRKIYHAPQTFEEAWKLKQAEGYNYGESALENVRMGWEMAKGI